MNFTTSASVKSATNFHCCRSSHHHHHYRTTGGHHYHRMSFLTSRATNNENKALVAQLNNNRTMDSLNYWKRAFGNPEQSAVLEEKMIRVGTANQQRSGGENNLQINACFPVIKDRKSVTSSAGGTKTACKCIIRPATKSALLKTLSPIQNSPQFLESPIAQMVRKFDDDNNEKLSKLVFDFMTDENKAAVTTSKITLQHNGVVDDDNMSSLGLYHPVDCAPETRDSGGEENGEKKQNFSPFTNKTVHHLASTKESTTTPNVNFNNNSNSQQDHNISSQICHENILLPLITDMTFLSSNLLHPVIYNSTNQRIDVHNNSSRKLWPPTTTTHDDDKSQQHNSCFHINSLEENNDKNLTGNTAVVRDADNASNTGYYDDEDGTLVFAIEI